MIEVRGLHKAFGQHQVLRGVDLTAGRGRSLVVLGGSGSGKSVLLKCILGLLTPDAGQITLEGAPVDRSGRARMGMLFQGGALFDSLPVWQNVAFRPLHHRPAMDKEEARALAVDCLARVGLGADVALRYPAQLSGGMQKRVSLARAIASNPDILFFDEPTTGLDPIMAGVINTLIRDVVGQSGATAITITHDMESMKAIADDVAMLHDGTIRWHGAIDDLWQSGDPYVDQFINGRAEGPIATLV